MRLVLPDIEHYLKYEQLGFILGMLSGLSLGVMAFLVHIGQEFMPSAEMVFYRSVLVALIFLPFSLRSINKVFSSSAGFLWLASFGAAVSIICYFSNLHTLSVGTAKALADFALVFVVVISIYTIGERLSARATTGVLLMLTAAITLHLDEFSRPDSTSLAVGLLGACAGGISYVALKHISATYPATLIVLCLNSATAIFSFFVPGEVWIFPTKLNHILIVLGVGAMGALGHYFLVLSQKSISAGVAASLSKSALFWAVLCAILFLSVYPRWVEWISYSLVFISIWLLYERPKKIMNRS